MNTDSSDHVPDLSVPAAASAVSAVSAFAALPANAAPRPIRHSLLPKLARCACFESHPDAGPAAARGTRLDAVFRALLSTGSNDSPADLESEDLAAVQWAVTTLRERAGAEDIFCEEADCRVTTPGMTHVGTADAIVPGRLLLADLKTGQIRNYREQMAAYALGLMEVHFADRWTCELLFCDRREVVTHHFTHAEALAIVTTVLSKAADPERAPSLCEYCGWCAKALTCTARRTAADSALALAPTETTAPMDGVGSFEALLEDPGRLSRFLAACKVLDDFREQAEARVRVLLETDPGAVPGWRLRRGGPVELVFPDDLARMVAAGNLSLAGVLEAHGALAAKKFRELWKRESSGAEVPAEWIRQNGVRRASLVQTAGSE
jgi:hypothetical protein